MIDKIFSTIFNHWLKKRELRYKQRLEVATKTSEERKAQAKEEVAAIQRHAACVVAIKDFSNLDEYTKYGKSGFDVEKFDEKVSNLKAGLEALLADVDKPELGYSIKIRKTTIELKREFFLATRIWHASILGQEYRDEKAKAASTFATSAAKANMLAEQLNRKRNDLVLENNVNT
jgi:hypothetical protein